MTTPTDLERRQDSAGIRRTRGTLFYPIGCSNDAGYETFIGSPDRITLIAVFTQWLRGGRDISDNRN